MTSPALAALAGGVRVPSARDQVFNDECLFSFDSPDSGRGLYVCMAKFVGLGEQYVRQYHQRTGNALFLHIKRTKVPKSEEELERQEKEQTEVTK